METLIEPFKPNTQTEAAKLCTINNWSDARWFVESIMPDRRWKFNREDGQSFLDNASDTPGVVNLNEAWDKIYNFAYWRDLRVSRAKYFLAFGRATGWGHLYAAVSSHPDIIRKRLEVSNLMRAKFGRSKPLEHRELVLSTSLMLFLERNKEQSLVAKYLLLSLTSLTSGDLLIHSRLTTGDNVSFLTFRDNGMISFMPKGKAQLFNDDGSWKKEGRQEAKPSRVIRQVFTPLGLRLFKEKDFELFNNLYKAAFLGKKEIEMRIVGPEQIEDIYLQREFTISDRGTLGGSCMNNHESTSFYGVLGARMVIMVNTDTNTLLGRALLWKATRHDTGEVIDVMDRIYSESDVHDAMFLEYAAEHNFYRKRSYASRDNATEWVTPSGEWCGLKLTIPYDLMGFLDNNSDANIPYIDTFCYGVKGSLRNFDTGALFSFSYTSGEYKFYDQVCGCWVESANDGDGDDDDDENDGGVYAVQLTGGTHKNKITSSRDVVRRDGKTYSKNDCVYLLTHDGMARVIIGEDILLDDLVRSDERHGDDGSWVYIRKTEAYMVEGSYYHESVVARVV